MAGMASLCGAYCASAPKKRSIFAGQKYQSPRASVWMAKKGHDARLKTELRGKAQRQLLSALRAREPGSIWTPDEMRRIGREAGMHKSTARAAVEALAFSPFMTATVGGYRLNEQ